MLTKHTYDSAEILLNIVTVCLFIVQLLIETLYEILGSIMAFIALNAIKVHICTPY